ncbi:MAG: hypothetical protein ACK5N0_14520 [Synechococcaceae cyanobacterium]
MASRHQPRGGQPPAHRIWAVGSRPMPGTINDGVQPPFQPLMAAVVNGHGIVIGCGASSPQEPLQGVEEALLQAIAKPEGGFGNGNQPLRVTVEQEELLPVVRRLLPGVPAKVGRSAELDELFQALPALGGLPEPQGIMGLKSYLDGDLTTADVARFFEASAELYRREPWTVFADDQCLFQLTSRSLAMNQWCGCVIGQAGESYGVLLFESRLDQQRFIQLAKADLDFSQLAPGRLPSQRAISFEPLDGISRELADEIHRHGWHVAPGDGYPVALHLDPNFAAVPNCREELARLEATARALTRLIDNTPELEDYWNWSGQEPLRRQYRVPVQDRGLVSVSLSLIPPEDEDDDQDFI